MIATRKALMCAAALCLAGAALPAAAQDARVVQLQTSVPAFCQSTPFSGGPSLGLGELIDADGHVVTAFAGTTQIQTSATYYCNAPATVSLRAEPLVYAAGANVRDGGFTNRVDYTATLNWAAVTGTSSSTATAATEIAAGSPTSGVFRINVSDPVAPGGRRPVAGVYAGAVIVSVTLQP